MPRPAVLRPDTLTTTPSRYIELTSITIPCGSIISLSKVLIGYIHSFPRFATYPRVFCPRSRSSVKRSVGFYSNICCSVMLESWINEHPWITPATFWPPFIRNNNTNVTKEKSSLCCIVQISWSISEEGLKKKACLNDQSQPQRCTPRGTEGFRPPSTFYIFLWKY